MSRTQRIDPFGRRWQRVSGVVLAAPLALAGGDPDFHVRVNHDLAPGEVVFGWTLDASGERMIYGVRPGTLGTRQIFSVSTDGSRDAIALTPPLPVNREISNWLPGRERVAFVCDLDTNEKFELYSVGLDGSRLPVKLSNLLSPSEDVLSLWITPDGSRALFLTAVPFTGRNTLNSVPLDGSQPAVALHVPEPGIYGFLAVRPTSDSGRVTYWSNIPSRLLSAPVNGSAAPLQLNTTTQVPDNAYVLSPDGQWIVYYSPTPGGSDVFSARVDGSTPPRPLFFPDGPGEATKNAPITPGAFQVTGDSRRVVGITTGFRELRVAPIDGSARPVVLADPEDVFRTNFRTTRDGRIVFEASPGGFLSRRLKGLYTVPMDGSSKAVRIHGLRGDPPPLKHEVSPQGDVVFDGLIGRTFHLFRVPIDGGEPFVQLSPPMVSGGNVYDANSVNGQSFQLSPDGSWLLYLADQEQNEVRELFVVAADGNPPVRKLNGLLPPAGDVIGAVFTPDSRRVLYSVWRTDIHSNPFVFYGEVFTSVIPDDGSSLIVQPGEPPPERTYDLPLVEDPGRSARERMLRGPVDSDRLMKTEVSPRY